MNILGIGVDIIEIKRIEKILSNNSKFLCRYFTEQEIEYFKSKNLRAESISGNFCAKEAISKALGTGIRKFNLKDLEILRDELGKPIVNTFNKLNDICIDYNISQILVSISHSEEYAVANAMIITKE